MALAAYHLPLDAHPVHGNNAGLAAALGATSWEPAFVHGGAPIGVAARFDEGGIDPEELLALEVDILAPSALENAITSDNAGGIRAGVVLEVANGPTAPEADDALADAGVTVIPDILANAGGVTVSYFEWAQNRAGVRWTADDVAERLKERMVTESEAIWDLAEDRDLTLRAAA